MNVYSYCGPVMQFKTCVERNWCSQTMAVSARKARSNFEHQWKVQNGLIASAKITLPGRIILVKEELN